MVKIFYDDHNPPHFRAECSSIHLTKETHCLAPDGIRWLSKKVCFPVARKEAVRRRSRDHISFGVPVRIQVATTFMSFLATAWSGRGSQDLTRRHLESLFALLGIPEW